MMDENFKDDPIIRKINKQLRDKLMKERKEEDIVKYLNGLFEYYRQLLEENKLFEQKIRDCVKETCNAIITCLEDYLKGNIVDAMRRMKIIMKKDSEIPMRVVKLDAGECWYRMRHRKPGDKLLTAKDMFHVPFEKRYKIGSFRYSVLGYPCLYASKSILGTWCEMDEPALENFAVSGIKVSNPVYLLDLTLPIDEERKQADGQIRMWPLVIACSIRVLHQDGKFIPEYIIPQLIMSSLIGLERIKVQYMEGGKPIKTVIDGCIYTSTKRNDAFQVDEEKWWNIAIPAKTSKSKGYCRKLANKLCPTNPICYSYSLLKGEINGVSLDHGTYATDNGSNQSMNANYTDDSLFGQMERILQGKDAISYKDLVSKK